MSAGRLAALPEELKPYADQVFSLIDSVFSAGQMPKIDDGRKPKTNPLNANFNKKEFQELWSQINRKFVKELDTSSEVVVYAKLPRGFLIPTPVGDYNPDWAISFQAGQVKHIYFVAETKGSMSSLKLREVERTKIECARKFFDEINLRITQDRVRYEVVKDYAKLMDIVGRVT